MEQRNIENICPLSNLQEALLLRGRHAPESGFYCGQLSCVLSGELNAAAFERAWQAAAERHPVLRTSFAWKRLDQPLQVVHKQLPAPIEQHDWRGSDTRRQAEQLTDLLRSERDKGFDPAKAPLTRLALCRTSDTTHHLVWSYHYLILDERSLPLVLREVFEIYDALQRGEEPRLPQPQTFCDYAARQKRQEVTAAESLWRESLDNFTSSTALPFDRAPAGLSAGDGYGERRASLSAEATEGLRSAARDYELDLSALVQGAWALLLSHYSGRDEVSFGVAIPVPDSEAAAALAGPAVNVLPARVQVSREAEVWTWLKELSARHAELRSFAHGPLAQGWSELLDEKPLFESRLVFDSDPTGDLLQQPRAGISISDFQTSGLAKSPVIISASPREELGLRIAYDRQRLDAATAERMLRHLRSVLEGIAAGRARRLADLPLLAEEERQDWLRLLAAQNETAADYPKDKCIHQLFEEQAGRTPDATAAVFRDERLSYAELNRRADRLASHLQASGCGPGSRVAILLEHSPEVLVALMGVLKAGAAYVPLDPEHPRARLAFVLEDAGVSVLLTQNRLLELLPETGAKTVCLDTEEEALAAGGAEPPRPAATPDDLAYVIYTSGSTGQPKGVKIRHRSLVNYVWWAKDVYGAHEGLSFALYSSLAFDLTVTSVYTPLVAGGAVVIYREEGRDVPLLDILRDGHVGVLKLTPSHLALVKDRDNRGGGVKRLIVGGEAFETALARRVHDSFGGEVEIFNEYGPTEATVACMLHKYDPARDLRASVPIGAPAANAQIYVLDDDGRPVTVNVTGELFIAGDGLADGYLNRDDLTSERFVPNPFVPGTLMYRSGDLARRLPDGTVEYVGRRDEQVKFHGYRVELQEIRSALNRHPQVRDSVAVLTKDKSGEDLLVAYYVARQVIKTSTLRAFLAESLIKETIPNIFVHLQKIPLTLNGKIDREALPAPDQAKVDREEDFIAPRTPLEEAVAGIWSEVLGIERIGVKDNFFEMGGHSLLVTKVIARTQELFNVELSMRSLFEATTVAELAEAIIAHETEPGSVERIANVLKMVKEMSPEDASEALAEEEREKESAP